MVRRDMEVTGCVGGHGGDRDCGEDTMDRV